MNQGYAIGALAAHAGLQQLPPGRIAVPLSAQTLRLAAADVPGRGTARGVGLLVVRDQGMPMLVAGTLDRSADIFPGQRQVYLSGACATEVTPGGPFVSDPNRFRRSGAGGAGVR